MNTIMDTTARHANEKWHPDHAISGGGATKEKLKAMTEFKYN